MLGQIVNIIVVEGGVTRPLNEHENLDIGLELDIRMSSTNYEANGCGHDLDLPIPHINGLFHIL